MANAELGADFQERFPPLVEKLQAERPRWIRDAGFLDLPANVAPRTDAGIRLDRGDRLTLAPTTSGKWIRRIALNRYGRVTAIFPNLQ